MPSLQQITLHGHWAAPNPYKVQIILEELAVPYEHKIVEFDECHNEPYIKVNPNGRMPAIEDPNTGLVLWESGAIVNYLVDEYDKEGRLTYSTLPEKHYIQQWLFFQASGQGPYYGQAVWFAAHHHEKLQSPVERYVQEIKRIRGVLDSHLGGRDWLVGDKCTIADLSWAMWENVVELLFQKLQIELEKEYPNYDRWFTSLKGRDSVKTAVAMRAKGIKDTNLIGNASQR